MANQGLEVIKDVKQTFIEGMNEDVVMQEEQSPTSQDMPTPMVCANRTKPVQSNKFAKRIGAKTAKNIELAKNADFTLSPADATAYRALAAR